MDIETFRTFCLSLPYTIEDFPFGPDNLVLKVHGKMFAITDLKNIEMAANLKCDPDRAVELRETYSEIIPGYHMNKTHWNTVSFSGGLSDEFLKELILHSYDLVYHSISKKKRAELESQS